MYEDEQGQPLYGEALGEAMMETFKRVPRVLEEVKRRYKLLYFVRLRVNVDPFWKTMPYNVMQEDGSQGWQMGSIAMLRHSKVMRVLGIPFCDAEVLVGEEIASLKDEDVLKGAVAHELSHLLVNRDDHYAVDSNAVKHGFGKELYKTFSYIENMFNDNRALIEEMEARKANIQKLIEKKHK
jgi:hypothetical protein